MRQNNLRANITNLSKNKVIKALVLESLGSRVSVKLGGSGKVLNGLEVVGGPVVAGQYILIDYASGTPIAKAIGQDQVATSISTAVTRISATDTDNPTASAHTHTESQIIDLDHDATAINGKQLTTSSGSPNEGDILVYSSGSWGLGNTDDYITDAPETGVVYGRQDKTWVPVTSGSYGVYEDHSLECNGATIKFYTNGTFVPNTTLVYLNGLLQRNGISYIEDPVGTYIEMSIAPFENDEFLILYNTISLSGLAAEIPSDIYVSTSGSDSGNSGTVGSPYATVTHALSRLPDELTSSCTIHVADGTYDEGIDISRFRCQYPVMLKIVGNTTTPNNVAFTGEVSDTEGNTTTISITGYVAVELEGIASTGTSVWNILIAHGARVIIDRCNAANATYCCLAIRKHAYMELKGNITITNANVGIQAAYQSVILQNGAGTVTINGSTLASSYGIQVLFQSQYKVTGVTGLHIVITNVKYGFSLGLHAMFQHIQATGSITVDNSSKPANSAMAHCTDLSTWSTNQTLTVDNFTYILEGNSICYLEAVGTRNITNVTGNSNVSQNSVAYLP